MSNQNTPTHDGWNHRWGCPPITTPKKETIDHKMLPEEQTETLPEDNAPKKTMTTEDLY